MGFVIFQSGEFTSIAQGLAFSIGQFENVQSVMNSFGSESLLHGTNSFGDGKLITLLAGMGEWTVQALRYDISPGAQTFQAFTLSLLTGNPNYLCQALVNGLVDETYGLIHTTIDLAEGLSMAQSVGLSIVARDAVNSLQTLASSMQSDASFQSIKSEISDGVQALQALLGEITEEEAARVITSMAQSLGLSMGGDGVFIVEPGIIPIEEKNTLWGLQKIVNELKDASPTILSTEYGIYLDGRKINNRITGCRINMSRNETHNSIEIQSSDKGLFKKCDPFSNWGNDRIEVRVGTRSFIFMLEDRKGAASRFSFWGRSVSAKDDEPFVSDWAYTLTREKSAMEVVEDVIRFSFVDWRVEDWTLPANTELSGSPIQAAQTIAAAIGAIVRAGYDNTIIVEKYYPVRPVEMPEQTPAVDFTRSNVLSADPGMSLGKWFDEVEVNGASSEENTPDIEVEESSPEIGQDVHLRVYWPNNLQPDFIETFVTDGLISYLGEFVETMEPEEVVFSQGKGSVSKPIVGINSKQWIGYNCGAISYDKWMKDIFIIDEERPYGIATITYQTRYCRYLCKAHNVESLLAVLSYESGSGVSVLVKIGDDAFQAPAITDDLITNDSVATQRGLSFLDQTVYDKKNERITVPYSDDIFDGIIIHMDDAENEAVGNYFATSASITFDGPKVTNEMEIEQCQTSNLS